MTPRFRTGSYSYSPEPREPQTWHGPPRRNRNRRGYPRRGSYRGRNPRSANRGGFRRRSRNWHSPPPQHHDDPPSINGPEPLFSPTSDHEAWPGRNKGFLAPPPKIPMIVSPRSREMSYSEILNGAYDLEKSPLALGKRLTASAEQQTKDWLLESPFNRGLWQKDRQGDLDTPTRRGKRNASTEIGNVGKHLKADTLTAGIAETGTTQTVEDSLPLVNQTGTVAVNFTQAPRLAPKRNLELTRLLDMVQQNVQRSNELADLVTNYINQHSADSQEKAPVMRGVKPFSPDDISQKMQIETEPRLSTLACGGDSPDPPRDNSKFARGHMIDKLDILAKSPLKTPEPAYDAAQGMRPKFYWAKSTTNFLTVRLGCKSVCQTSPPGGSPPNGKRNGVFLEVPNASFRSLPYRIRPSELRSAAASPGNLTRRPYSPLSATSRQSDAALSHTSVSSCSHGRSRWRSNAAPSPESEIEFIDVPLWRNNPATREESSPLIVSIDPLPDPEVIDITPPGSSNASVKAQAAFSDRSSSPRSSSSVKVGLRESRDNQSTKLGAQPLPEGGSRVNQIPDSDTRDKRTQSERTSSGSRKDDRAVHGKPHLVKSQRPTVVRTSSRCNPNSPCWQSGLCDCTPQASPECRMCPACGRPKESGK